MGRMDRRSLLKLLSMGAVGLGPSCVVGRAWSRRAALLSWTSRPAVSRPEAGRQLTGPLTTRLSDHPDHERSPPHARPGPDFR